MTTCPRRSPAAVEARDSSGAFHPLQERLARWTKYGPEELIELVRRDLLAHTGGSLGDDAAIVAVRRTAIRHAEHLDGELVAAHVGDRRRTGWPTRSGNTA
ncbi:SpoIIE family protein phosphatase [Streptomyces sp. MI02-7b]|nr:SpoIIE family protein phosphatase [Streptomyces sp. MI02-7b]